MTRNLCAVLRAILPPRASTDTRPAPKTAQRPSEPRREANQAMLCSTAQNDPVEEARIVDRRPILAQIGADA